MPRVLRTDTAQQDLDGIWDYLAEQNPDAADGFLDRFERLTKLVAVYPRLGTSCGEFGPGLRAMTVKGYPHIVFFRAAKDGICVVRVLHGRQEITRKFFGE